VAALAYKTRRNLKRLGRVAEILNHTSRFNHLEKALLSNYQASRELQEQNLGLDKYFSNEEYTECRDDEEQWVVEQLTVLTSTRILASSVQKYLLTTTQIRASNDRRICRSWPTSITYLQKICWNATRTCTQCRGSLKVLVAASDGISRSLFRY
jgi:hypothetical protein